jgi:hypothetical protein
MKDSVNKTYVGTDLSLSVPVKYEPALCIWYRIFLFSRRACNEDATGTPQLLKIPAAFIA